MVHLKNRIKQQKANTIFDIVHSHLTGPIEMISLAAIKYTCFVDNYSSLILVEFLKHKNDTFLATKKYLTHTCCGCICATLKKR